MSETATRGASRKSALADRVEAHVERLILDEVLAPGQRLNENALATELGISRAPVREACRRLEQRGLVRIVLNAGVFVRSVSLREALDVYDIRAGLARVAGQSLARRASAEQVADLWRRHEAMGEAAERFDTKAFHALNLDFHERLMACAENERLCTLYGELSKELHLFRYRSIMPPGTLRISQAEHRRILEAVQARDEAAAGRAFEQHVQRGKQRFLETVHDTTDREPA